MNIQQRQYQQNPQFTAIRRVNCNLNDFLKISEKYGEKLDSTFRIIFKNKSVDHAATSAELVKIAQKEGTSLEWIMANCKQHGIKLPDINLAPVYDFTEESVLKLYLFKLKGTFRELFYVLTHGKKAAKEVPQHLIGIKVLNDYADKNLERFEKFVTKNNVEDVTLEEFIKILEK